MLAPFWFALQFLTRLPTPRLGVIEPQIIGRSAVAYPLVGVVIGGLSSIPLLLFADSHALLQAALVLVVWVLTTGGLHLDGLADSADAWLGGEGDPQRSLEIMKDPRAGSAAIVLVVLVLVAIVEQGGWLAIVLVPALGRASVVALLLTTPYVRPGGLGETLVAHLPRHYCLWAVVVTGVLFLLGGGAGVQALVFGVLVAWGVRRLMQSRIAGTTGDTAGALLELTEAAAIVGWGLALWR